MKRDEHIDILRGFAMTWVILIHCLYWVGFFQGTTQAVVKSFLLIEMPLFFFISGASYMFSKKKSYFEYLKSRGKRILIPYWCYIGACILLAFLINTEFAIGQIAFIIPKKLPNFGIGYLNSALWFIWPFILVSLSLPILKSYFDWCQNLLLKLLPIVLTLLLIFLSDRYSIFNLEWKSWMMYSLFSYMGFFYPMLKSRTKAQKRLLLSLGIVSILVTIVLGRYGGYGFDMQINKFDYNFIFTIYNIGVLSMFYVILDVFISIIKKLKNSRLFAFVFTPYEKNNYTIFLFHPIAFLLIGNIILHFSKWSFLIKYQFITFPFLFMCYVIVL